jgi:hypothetical protein
MKAAEKVHSLALMLADGYLAGDNPALLLAALGEARRQMLREACPRTPHLPLPPVYDPGRHALWPGPCGKRPPRPVVDPQGRRFDSMAEAALAWGVTSPCVGKWVHAGKDGWRDAA